MLSERKNSKTFAQFVQNKLILPKQVKEFCASVKASGKSIVTINGSFDLLHPGHLEMLYQASKQADVFIVLLNTDRSIQEYKSKNRPINSLEIRLQHMAALEMVDYVSYFDETDPIAILSKIKPDVHANGSEYGEACIESKTVKANGGKIHVVNLVDGYSTTNIIKKIQMLCD